MPMVEGRKTQMGNTRRRPAGTRQWADVIAAPPRPAAAVHNAAATSQRGMKAIDISFSFPTIDIKPIARRLKNRLRGVSKKAWAISVLVVLVGAAISTYAAVVISRQNQQAHGLHTVSNLPQGTPDYRTILPTGKSIATLGGWSRVSPPDRNPVYAYADKLDGVQIAVSQQPLPQEFTTDTDSKISQLATSYNASQKVTFNDHDAFYIGTSAKGPQSVILAKDGLLILIKSDAKINTNDWVQYISSLN